MTRAIFSNSPLSGPTAHIAGTLPARVLDFVFANADFACYLALPFEHHATNVVVIFKRPVPNYHVQVQVPVRHSILLRTLLEPMSFTGNNLKISNSEACCIINASPHPDELRVQSPLTPCPKCDKPFRRPQNLKRHIMSLHLPCWIYCSRSGCSWRGHRKDELKRHLSKQKCGSKPWDNEYRIYEPKMILNWILKDQVPVGVGASYALVLAGEKAMELRKEEDWTDFWGGKGREDDMATELPGLLVGCTHSLVFT
ncbi:hypothetical protein BGW80DRAFT_1314612 [Lactifluus volemus]|nr:hypothetical protein BGW80DRAFT_1314612 [Lactifluus volemus]